jgi:hypothetical protein
VESSTSLLLFLFVPNAALLSLSACVGHREADGAGPITGSLRPLFGREEDAVVHIAIRSNGTQHGGAVKTTIDAVAAVSTQYSWHSAGVWFVVGADKSPELAHVYRPIFPFYHQHRCLMMSSFLVKPLYETELWRLPRSG